MILTKKQSAHSIVNQIKINILQLHTKTEIPKYLLFLKPRNQKIIINFLNSNQMDQQDHLSKNQHSYKQKKTSNSNKNSYQITSKNIQCIELQQINRTQKCFHETESNHQLNQKLLQTNDMDDMANNYFQEKIQNLRQSLTKNCSRLSNLFENHRSNQNQDNRESEFQLSNAQKATQEIKPHPEETKDPIILDLEAIDYFMKKHQSYFSILKIAKIFLFQSSENLQYLGIIKTIQQCRFSLRFLLHYYQHITDQTEFSITRLIFEEIYLRYTWLKFGGVRQRFKRVLIWYNVLQETIQVSRMFKTINDIRKFLKYWNQRIPKKIQTNPQELKLLTKKFIRNSQIVNTKKYAERLINFFEHKVKGIRLIYRGSENKFSNKKFLQQYGHIKNTLIVCETVDGQIFGGYTPLPHGYTGKGIQTIWDKRMKQQSVMDETVSSFIFELNSGAKRYLRKGRPAIKRAEGLKLISLVENELNIIDWQGLATVKIQLKSIYNLVMHDDFSYYRVENKNWRELRRNEIHIFDWEVFQIDS